MSDHTIYFAPLQGYTDFIYRRAYAEIFGNVDKYFIPYITSENDGSIRKSKLKEIFPENNIGLNVIPQILPGSEQEAEHLAQVVKDHGYSELNLNLGCPYPMVVNRGKGSGLLQHPEKIDKILDLLCNKLNLKISVKTRTGLADHNELEQIIPVFNNYPIDEIIIHPRVGKQLYKGNADMTAFQKYKALLKHPVIYNGDINTENFQELMDYDLKDQSVLMLGRGILQDPFLPWRIKKIDVINEKERIIKFIDRLTNEYAQLLQSDTFTLKKIQVLFEYIGEWFPPELKIQKKVKKLWHISELHKILHSL